MSVAEQRYLAVLAVIADGHDVTAAAPQCQGLIGASFHVWANPPRTTTSPRVRREGSR